MKLWQHRQRWLQVIALTFLGTLCGAAAHQALQTNKPSEAFPVKDGPVVNVIVERPAEMDTQLQVLCFFEYRAGEKNLGAEQELDHKLRGIILDLRKSGNFAARPLETMVIAPLPYSIRPRQLLLIGLGQPEELSLELLKSVGRVGMREALRMGVRQYAQSFDLRDGGSTAFSIGDVARSIIEGALSAYATERELQERGLADERPMSRVTYLTTLESYKETVQGVKQAIRNTSQSVGQAELRGAATK